MEIDTETNFPIINYGVLTRTDGSVILSQGKTTVIAGVYGPIETKAHKLLIDKASVETHFRPKSGLPGVGDRLHETIIRNICETALVAALYPRSTVLIILQEMQDGGELITCSVNAACLALLESGLDMKFLIAAVTCHKDEDENLITDLPMFPQKKIKATFVMVFDSSEGRVIASHTSGCFSVEQYEKAIHICREKSSKIFDYYKSIIVKKNKQLC